jgi:hypothetical protein
MPQTSTWRCQSCRAVLGTVRHGTLAPVAPVVKIDANGAAHVRCPSCSAVRAWKPKVLSDQNQCSTSLLRPR